MIDLAVARAALGRAPILLPDPVPDHPLLAGKAELGRGEYSVVLEQGDGQRVCKVVSSPADYFLYTAADRPTGPHFPRVLADHGRIGRARSGYPFYLVEMERLYPLPPGHATAILAERLIEQYWEGCQQWSQLGVNMGRIALYHMTLSPLDLPVSVAQALKALSDFVEEYQVQPDILNTNNLMMRKDGTLVFSDPVFIA